MAKGDIAVGRELASATPLEITLPDLLFARRLPYPDGGGLMEGWVGESSINDLLRICFRGLPHAAPGARALPLANESWSGDEDRLAALIVAAALTSLLNVCGIRLRDSGGADVDLRGGAGAGVDAS
mmetsp:Transcript_25090/g.39717  ORF Transcript_25090/g.39717 Transcript_25090/m.39717 type:complete len:126 (-) Transcript_25090:1151-1528(-)